MSILEQLSAFFGVTAEDEEPAYHVEYIRSLNYSSIETTTVVDEEEYIRCNLCGRLFDTDEMGDALDHVHHHDGQIGEEIDPFERVQQIESQHYE